MQRISIGLEHRAWAPIDQDGCCWEVRQDYNAADIQSRRFFLRRGYLLKGKDDMGGKAGKKGAVEQLVDKVKSGYRLRQ